MTTAAFAREVDRLMVQQFGITWADAGRDVEELRTFQKKDRWTPIQVVQWLGKKYDLIPLEEF
jgi:hypothetical protein